VDQHEGDRRREQQAQAVPWPRVAASATPPPRGRAIRKGQQSAPALAKVESGLGTSSCRHLSVATASGEELELGRRAPEPPVPEQA